MGGRASMSMMDVGHFIIIDRFRFKFYSLF